MKLVLKQLLSLVLVITLAAPSTLFAQQFAHTLDTNQYKNAQLAEAKAMQLTDPNFIPEKYTEKNLWPVFVPLYFAIASNLTAFMIAANSNVSYSPTYKHLDLSELEIITEPLGPDHFAEVTDLHESRLRDYLRIRYSEYSEVELPTQYGEPRRVTRNEIFHRFKNLDQIFRSIESHFTPDLHVKPRASLRNGPLGYHYYNFDFTSPELIGRKSITDNQLIEAIRCLQFANDPILITKNPVRLGNLLDAIKTFGVLKTQDIVEVLDEAAFDQAHYRKLKLDLIDFSGMRQHAHEHHTVLDKSDLKRKSVDGKTGLEDKLLKNHQAQLQERILKRTNQNIFKASMAALVITGGIALYYYLSKDSTAPVELGEKYNLGFEDILPMTQNDQEEFRFHVRQSENLRIYSAMLADELKFQFRKSKSDLELFDAYNAQFKKLN